MLRKGEWVWVDSKIGVPIGARVKETPSGQRLLVDDEGNERRLSLEEEASLKIMHPTSVEGVDDMIKLGDMTEAALLRNLLLRHKQGHIYTFIGSVLVAVNPYQDFPIYSAEQVSLYHSRKLGELPPHIFAIAESCYFNMKRNLTNQCCIISGESGAGKTESTKLILQYLAAVSGQLSQQSIENQILQSNPILEAFGNAKTIRNDNSSRFGKYLEIFFNKDGVIEGARVEQYLLEKSRVCHQASEERNYHIFYCLLAGITTEERKMLRLDYSKEYNYITKGNCVVCEGRDDAKDFSRIRLAMKTLNFSEDQFQEILKLLAAMLHLGNVNFQGSTVKNLETSDVGESENFTIASSLLQVQRSVLADSLTHRSFMTNRERVTKALSAEQATDCRDAFVKAIYNKLFIWIVGKINSVIYQKLSDKPSSSLLSIGLLDIFGFENFQTNSFEQLCINFANEKLQQFFVAHIFKLEQKEYQKEGVLWNNIQFTDNQKVLELLAGKPCNVLALIDEESHFPQGTDSTLLTKLNKEHKGDKAYIGSKSEHETDFGIRHFAGPVYYNTNGFLEKNRDGVSYDIIKTIGVSTSKLLREIFEKDMSTNGLKATKAAKFILTPQSSPRLQNDKRKQMPTLSGQFRVSLDSLMKALSACQPFFIRCFKPNNDKQSKKFDRELCTRQLRYSGMMDTIRIRKLGYPVRHKFEDFLSRYRVLLKTTVCDPRTTDAAVCCEAICKAVIRGRDEWRIGRKKIFLKDAHDAVLENLREAELSRVAVVIQRVMLGIKDRKLFLRKRGAAVVLQKQWRASRERIKQKKIQQGLERLVSKVRGRKLKAQYQKQRGAAIVIQSQVRGYRARKDYRQKREEIARQALLLEMERQEQEDLGEELHQRLMQVAEEQADIESQKSVRSHKSENSSESEKASESEHFSDSESEEGSNKNLRLSDEDMEDKRSDSEDVQEADDESPHSSNQMTVVITPASNAASPTLSLEEEEEEVEDDFDDETNIFSFYNFSKRHFQKDEDHKHTPQRLKHPLLHHEDEGDALASLTVSWIIMRFMGDIPEQRPADSISQQSSTVSQSTLSRLLPGRQGRRLSNLVGLDQKILRKNKKKFGGGNRKASAILEEPENLTEDEDIDILVGESTTLDRQLTQLEKLHIIVGYGLSRQGIRDEIYCQICKQLVNNRNRKSCMQGWALLSLCLGIFPPTSLFMECLESFLERGPYGYREYCIERLHRIVANGDRKELPCWLELKAANNKEPIDWSVTLMSGETVKVQLDSASTSAEVCQAVANKIGLKDTFGFSVYISFYEKMWSLGSYGKNHVLDAVSQCEQEMRRQGREEKDTPWSLSIRKELFSPWHDCDQDAVSTDLIYKQVIKGIKSGEYVSEKEDEYVQLAAMHYFVRFGSQEPTTERVRSVVQDCITTTRIESRSMTMWIDLITAELSKERYNNGRLLAEKLKGDVVDIARQNWPLDFSKLYEVTMTSGPPLPKSRFFVAVNWKSIVFMERREKLLLEIPYVEVKKVQMASDSHQSVNMDTLRGQYTLRCQDGADMAKMMQYNVDGLRQRSVYAVVQQDIPKQDDPIYLICKRGDLLLVEKDSYPPDSDLIRAVNQRTKSSGVVYKDKMEFLPTLTEPAEDMLNLFSPKQRKASVPTIVPLVEETVAPVSLKEFALENFRSGSKGGGRGAKGANKEKLWIFSKEPIKQPLLKTLLHNPDLSNMACNAFIAILKYMGDYPIKQSRSPTELTDQIFGPATKHEELQDEIYCQIMRQMTTNSSRMSVDRGWQLMWMCTGLFPPGPRLRAHAQRFLESRPRDPLAAGCLQRFQDFSSKEPRTLPPHQAEVEAIQQNSTQIFYKVHFPNDTDALVEVSSTITNRELRYSIAAQLSLSSAEGYGLYMKVTQKMMSLDEDKYFFDSLRQPPDVTKKGKKVKEVNQPNAPLLVVYRRKLWFNVIPGKDLIADLTFHYPQEVPKYLRGYLTCTKEDMFNLGGLLFRVAVDSDRSQFVMIPRMLNELVPVDKVQMMQPEEWKKHIIASYNKQSGMTVQEAKIAFLRAISSWPYFGCSFFDVKQTCESDYPNTLWFTVSKKGVSLIDPRNKELLVMHPFNRIIDYSSTGNIFQMTIRTLVKGINFVCATPQAGTIEDLVKSYVRMYEEQKMISRPKNTMFP
ncbi:unconventional myosin-VIIa-like isoform X2 [Poeciliopsis prolifica]|uniref:unconventional myosin-VIIa-like isoform X2 n=1 Tax=Poeciliopsis prolifica TaxID=188132 RepID=UPI0024137CE6|nr:unconventional myosin-VIIa-like isoform X2 [Poeciliopsis prolifica]